MNKKRVVYAVLAAVMALGVVGVVSAQGPDGDNPGSGSGGAVQRPRGQLVLILVQTVADSTGLSLEDVWAQALDGKTLAAICQENGADPQTVIDSAKTQATEAITQAVTDGKLTQRRADRMMGQLDNALDRMMNTSLPAPFARTLELRGARELVQVLSEKTGLTPLAIGQQVRDGATLAEIATENGVDPDAVSSEALARTTDTLTAAVANGKITQEQMDALLAAATAFYPEAMTQTLPDRPTPIRDRLQPRLEDSLVGVVADLAGMKPLEVVREWRNSDSLAQVVEAHGLTVDAVIAEAETRVTADVSQAVSDGKITQDQADQILSGLHDRLVERINVSFPPKLPRIVGRGFRGGLRRQGPIFPQSQT